MYQIFSILEISNLYDSLSLMRRVYDDISTGILERYPKLQEEEEVKPRRDSGEFRVFAKLCDSIAATRSKLEKVKILSEYLRDLTPQGDLKIAVTFLSGRVFPPGAKEANVGVSTLWNVIREITNSSEREMSNYYRRHGDLGYAIEDLLKEKRVSRSAVSTQGDFQTTLFAQSGNLTLDDLHRGYVELAKSVGPGSQERKKRILKRLFSKVAIPEEAKYIVKILTGEMRIGLVEGLLEEAIAAAFKKPLAQVRMANLILADAGALALRSAENDLERVTLEPLQPTNFMLADSAPTAEALFEKLGDAKGGIRAEYKYDGIRAQLHLKDGELKIFSRNLADVTKFFPELDASKKLAKDGLILDGEIIPFSDGRPLSFQLLQRRLRKITHSELDAPVKYLVFDVLYIGGTALISEPLRKRAGILSTLDLPENAMALSEKRPVSSAKEIYDMFVESKSLGYEGLVVKDLESPYTPGRRGGNWVKLKKELETLDVVIVACEYGHGKRAGVISDYTFALRDGDSLRVIGKAYSGLTDVEIAEMTELMKSITTRDEGYRRLVEPRVVLEVAFDAITKSDRHDSGYALRFPRIKRIRTDKSLNEIDDLDRLKKIYESQQVRA